MSFFRSSAERWSVDQTAGLMLAESVQQLSSDPHPGAVATRVLEFAIHKIPCGYAGLTDARDGVMVAVSDPVVEAADRLQDSCGEGPRLLPSSVEAGICVVDTATDVRWPRWGQGVAALGLRSMLTVKLSAKSAGVGTLVLYSSEPGWFGPAEQDLAVAVARHASVAIVATRRESRLRLLMATSAPTQAAGLAVQRPQPPLPASQGRSDPEIRDPKPRPRAAPTASAGSGTLLPRSGEAACERGIGG